MSSFNKIIASVACLAATTLAYPASESSSLLARQWVDCPAPTVYYKCANGYVGCYTSDPCALPPLKSTPTSAPAAVTPTPVSTSTTVARSCPADSTASATYFEPEMYNLFPSDPSLSQPEPVNYINVRTDNVGSDPKLEQVVVFRGIPTNAKTCSLGWRQSSPETRNFTVQDNGSVLITQLSAFPAAGEPVSVNSIAPYETKNTFTGDFTNWDKDPETKLPKEADDHSIGGIFACAQELYFKTEINTPNQPDKKGSGSVLMAQDFQNGYYLSYTC